MEIEVVENPILSTQNAYVELSPPQPLYRQPFVSAILFLREVMRKLLESATDARETSETTASLFETGSSTDTDDVSLQSLDSLHFGFYSTDLASLKKEGLLLNMIKDRQLEICEQKEHWRPVVEELKKGIDQDLYFAIECALEGGKLIANPLGCGSAYYIIDKRETARFVVKPVDEDIFCLNNRKEFGSPFNDSEHRVRDGIPLYRSAQTDAFCWDVASLADLEGTTPRATMYILKDDRFYDFSIWMDKEEELIRQTSLSDKEKLCSVQEFIPDSQDLIELLHEFYKQGLSDEEIASCFDQKEFEEVCMLLWLSYDNDAHASNFLTYAKRIDEKGKKLYGIKKIDNGLSFPEKNTQYANILTWVPNAILPISPELKQKIAALPVDQILRKMDDYELSSCKGAFKERVEILKELAQREGITICEIDLRFSFLSLEEGGKLALSTMTTQQILDILYKTTKSTQTQNHSTTLDPHILVRNKA
jgi:hypothetical protein